MRPLPVCALVLALATQHAGADGPRYRRDQPAPARVPLSAIVLPAPAPTSASAASAAPAARAPLAAADALPLVLGRPVGTTRPEQEQILERLLAATPDAQWEEKADYYYRIATIHADDVRRQAAILRELALTVAATPPAKQRLQADVQRAQYTLKSSLLKAVKRFKGLTDNAAFARYPRLDQALFAYGYTLQLGKYMKEARAVYDKLVKDFPSSSYVPTAHLALAEYYFEAGLFADAETRYRQVLKVPASEAYWYATYKLAWIEMHVQRYEDALEAFFRVTHGTRNDTKQQRLRDAARADFVAAYAKIGKPEKAFEAFSRVDAAAAPEMVLALATELGLDKPATLVETYRQLVQRAPTDARACRWQYRVAHGSLHLQDARIDAKVREIEALAALHATLREAALARGEQEDSDCRDLAAVMTGELAAAYHAEWGTTQSAETLGYAERLYAAHVATFPAAAPQARALAEVRWSLAALEHNAQVRARRWETAAAAFAALGTVEGEHIASLAWLNAVDFVAPLDGKLVVRPARGRAPRAKPIAGRDQPLVAALTAYLAHPLAADDAHAQMRLLLATTLRRYAQHDAAVDVLDAFLAQHATHASAELAANLLLDSLVQLRSSDLPAVVSAMLADQQLVAGKPHLLANLTRLRAASSRS